MIFATDSFQNRRVPARKISEENEKKKQMHAPNPIQHRKIEMQLLSVSAVLSFISRLLFFLIDSPLSCMRMTMVCINEHLQTICSYFIRRKKEKKQSLVRVCALSAP